MPLLITHIKSKHYLNLYRKSNIVNILIELIVITIFFTIASYKSSNNPNEMGTSIYFSSYETYCVITIFFTIASCKSNNNPNEMGTSIYFSSYETYGI
jgi:uncharacterized membrane protein